MSQPPQLDLHSISEELSEIPEVNSISTTQDGIVIKLEDESIFVFQSSEHQQPNNTLEETDRAIFAVETGFLEFGGGTTVIHKNSDSGNHRDLLRDIIANETDTETLETGDALEILHEEGHLPAGTPKAVAELLAGWAVTSEADSVLDIATGSGTLLRQARHETVGDLVGLEIHPVVAKLARARLECDQNTEIIDTDFFDWETPQQQKSLEEGEYSSGEEKRRKFDAVVGNPPAVRAHHIAPEKREQMLEWYSGSGRSAAALFVAKAVTHLKEGGRGSFLLPKAALRDGLLEHLMSFCGIHRIVELPVGTFSDSPIEAVILTLIKEERSREVRKTGVAKFNQSELPDNARGLLEQPLDEIVQNRYNPYNAELVRASHADLEGGDVMRILSNPPIHDIITSDEFTRFGDLSGVDAGTGVVTGNNEFFYFDSKQKAESDINDRFFRPVIKNPDDGIRTITIEDIDLYLLDPQPYIEELEDRGVEVTEDSVVEELRKDGYEELAEYIEGELENLRGEGLKFVPNRIGKFHSPDLVIQKFFDDPRCYKVQVENALFDSTVVGIRIENEELREPLARLLNTPVYKEFFQTFADPLDLDWYQINISSIHDIPIIRDALSQDVSSRMDPFFPPEDDNDLVRLNHLLIESCESDNGRDALRRYLASREEYTWSWLMSLPEFEEFQELLESDKEEAREFILNRFDQELLDQARNTFENIDFFEERRELLNDLLMEFEEGHYRAFLAGISLQFEGILVDLVEEAGGEVIEKEYETKFKMSGEGRSRTMNLSSLISRFFDGVFGTFLDETVRQRRNQIAHGDVIEDNRDLSMHFFISFYALCTASLNEYVRLADRHQ